MDHRWRSQGEVNSQNGGDMKKTVISMNSFVGDYQTGLIFSMIDGLREGASLKVLCQERPERVERYLTEAGLEGLRWGVSNVSGEWELAIERVEVGSSWK